MAYISRDTTDTALGSVSGGFSFWPPRNPGVHDAISPLPLDVCVFTLVICFVLSFWGGFLYIYSTPSSCEIDGLLFFDVVKIYILSVLFVSPYMSAVI